MFSIDVILQDIPLPVSVQRKEADAAESLYQALLEAMRSEDAKLFELTCEKEEDKKVTIKTNRICAVSVNKKSGSMAEGRVPGFFAAIQE
ncbi:hypothetical protein [Myxosarcina sp. GI1]|uniref:hypothetical protein n=1 Tax=Myxosarcina sp. GI1 TaxID=1541065 RepID=UPI00056C4118|nr:hypothetical protein [Myxosarcina sp. GI1]